jgi:hypothetical protein
MRSVVRIKKRIGIVARRTSVYSYYGLGFLAKRLSNVSGGVLQNIIYYPIIKDKVILADLANRASWYFPESKFSNVNVFLAVDKSLATISLGSLQSPAAQKRYVGKFKNIHLIDESELDLTKADAIMLWDQSYRYSSTILKQMAKVFIVDNNYYFSIEADTSRRMYHRTVAGSVKSELLALSKNNFGDLLSRVKGFERAYVFGTGPSLDNATKFDYSDGFRVVCNSIVKNEKIMDHIKPHLLVFGDPQHHTSPCKYAAAFREAAVNAVNKFDCYILTEDYHLPLLLAHYPDLKDRIIGIEAPGVWEMSLFEIIRLVLTRPHKLPWFDKIPGHDDKYNFPTLDKFYVRLTGSVLPSYMVPVASAACKEICIIGADGRDPKGRKPDETYIWGYSSTCQFYDLMQTAFDTHPSYFRDRPFTEDFNIYCENFDELITFGESMGKKYYTLMPSFIPALAKRFAPHKATEFREILK